MRTNESPEFFNTTRGRMKEQALNLKFGEELSATVFENGCLELWHNSRGQLALRNNGLQSARSDFKSGYHQVKDFQISIFGVNQGKIGRSSGEVDGLFLKSNLNTILLLGLCHF